MAVVRDEDWKYVLGIFIAESTEMLDSVEPRLMQLETLPAGRDDTQKLLNEIFRLFHSLKGGAASFDLNVIRDVTHQMENMLEIFRSQQKPVKAIHIDLMCKTCDLIRKCLPRVAVEFADVEFTGEATELHDLITRELLILEGKSPTTASSSKKSDSTKPAATDKSEATKASAIDDLPELSAFDTFFTPPHSNFAGSRADLNLFLTPTMLAQFIQESEVSFSQIEAHIEFVNKSGYNSQFFLEAFREIHTFKGMSIFFGYPTLSDPANLVETLIDLILLGSVPNLSDVLSLLKESVAALRSGLECLKKSEEVVVDPGNLVAKRLESAISKAKATKPAPQLTPIVDRVKEQSRAPDSPDVISPTADSGLTPTQAPGLTLVEMQLNVSPQMLEDFLGFARELFDDADAALVILKNDTTAIDKIEKAFQAIHSFSGTSGFFGFKPLMDFARLCELVLNHMIRHPIATATEVVATVTDAVKAMRTVVERLKTSGPELGENEIPVLKRLSEILAEFGKTEGMAEFFPAGAVLEEVFDPSHLKTFRDESMSGIAALERLLSNWSRDPEDTSFAPEVSSTIHALKSGAATLITRAKKPLPSKHPLQFFRVVAHGAEMIVSRDLVYEESLMGIDEFETLFKSVETLKSLREAFFARESTVSISEELLARLSINAAQFRETDLALMEACLKNIEHSPENEIPDAVRAYLRSLRNLESACKRLIRPDVGQLVERQKTLLDSWIKNQASHFSTLLPEIKKEYAALLECINAPPPAGAVPGAVVKREHKPPEAAGVTKGTLRIDEEKIDRLLRAVGELFVVCESFSLLEKQLANGSNLAALSQRMRETGEGMAGLTSELEKGLMAIRLVPVKSVFQRFPRIIRDLARQLGKEVQLQIRGEDTEIDKKTLEQINDPLVHLIRNSVDHGVELPDKRRETGKPVEGVVILSASIHGDQINIAISDDGKGLSPVVLKNKAIERGIITPEEATIMTDREAYNLIFAAGFSTAEKVTDVSGRGVGMDVVRNNISALQGTVEIESKVGEGSTFTLKLPIQKLCLMVFQTVLVQAGQEEYLLPMENVAYLVNIPTSQIHVYSNMLFVPIHEKLYPMAFLDRLLDTRLPAPAGAPNPDISIPRDGKDLAVALIRCSAGEYALGFDRFISEERVVVKPLKSRLVQSPLFSGSAIMGDGRVSLVLEPINLAEHFTHYSEYIADKNNCAAIPAPLPRKR
ncbi:MAG: Hpt domain-containing protein [Candidatus Riflebacteria bacterium]|nr:Hpt domain-containing protein [Candidatus Riflebacteria bacterium]